MTERWRDVAHIGHAELLTPTPEASLEYFTALLGLTVVSEEGGSWYLRGYGDYEPYCLKLTAASSPGLGHMAVRVWSPEALTRRVEWLKAAGIAGGWVEPEAGKGPAYEFTDPDGHPIRIYYETSKYVPPAGHRPAMKSNHQRYRGVGANVRRLEHVNLMARDVRACREFWADGLGLRTFEIIRRDDGSEDGAWLSSTVQGHEVIYVRDYLAGAYPHPGVLPLHPRAWREPHRGLLRRLPRLRPRRQPRGVDPGGVRRQARLGRAAPCYVPHLRHSPAWRTRGIGHLRLARPRVTHPATIVCLRGDHDRRLCLPDDHDRDRYVLYAAPAAKKRRMMI